MIITIERSVFEPILNKQKDVIGWNIGFKIDRDDLSYYNPTTIMRNQLSDPNKYTEQEVMRIAIRNSLVETLASFYQDKVEHTPQFTDEEIANWGVGVVPHQEEIEDNGEDTDSSK